MSDGPTSRRPLLLAGIPRCGSTWTMRTLGTDPSILMVNEPDNEGRQPTAIWAKGDLGRFPTLEHGQDDERYRRLWTWALDGAPTNRRLLGAGKLLHGTSAESRAEFFQGRRSPRMQLAGLLGAPPRSGPVAELAKRRLLVKTVHTPLALDWLTGTFDLDVVVLFRHPGNVLSSWRSLQLTDQFARVEDLPSVRRRIDSGSIPPRGSGPVERTVWLIGLLTLALEEEVAKHPDWIVRTHEELCRNPQDAFRRLFAEVDLPWTDGVEQFLVANDRPGEGFVVTRVASDAPEAWKTRLDAEEITTMQQVLGRFPLTGWSAEDYVP